MPKRGRIDPIDAARGCAMLLVCLSHVKQRFEFSAPLLYEAATWITRTATPTFLLLSGFIAAYVLRGDSPRRTAVTLVDRGLFLLLVAHLLLDLVELPRANLFEWLFVRVMITDAIGVALCLAVLLRNASAGMLITLGSSVFVLSWLIGITLVVDSAWASHVGSVLFKIRSAPNPLVDVALLPYLGVFMIGMGLSGWLKDALAAGDEPLLARRLLTVGFAAVGTSIAVALAWHFFKGVLPATTPEAAIELYRLTLHPGFKWPPSPSYLLFYGGGGLLIAGLFFYGRSTRVIGPIVAKTSVFGRASLMCFVVQDWLLFVTPEAFGFADVTSPAFWLGYYGVCVVALYVLASAWGRVRGNRFLTIGLKRLLLRREAAHRPAAPEPENDAAPAPR